MNILVLCTHNSCRSVIAEGLLQHYGKGKFKAYSAGSFPSGKINPRAIETLRKNNINADYNNFKSQSWDDFEYIKMDIVITVCDQAAGESCPLFLGSAIKAHWGVEDPSSIKSSETEVNEAFQKTFKMLEKRVIALTNLDIENLDKEELHSSLNAIGKEL